MPASPSTRLGLIGPLGADDVRDGDDIIRAIIATLDPKAVIFDQGAIGSRPASNVVTPGIAGRFYRDTANGILYFDYGTGWQGVALAEVTDFTALGSLDIFVSSTAKLLTLEYAIETTARPELRLTPNADTSALYSDVRDGSYLTNDGVSHAVAATGGGFRHNNGLRLAWPAQGSSAGGMSIAGRATIALGPSKRTCIAQASVLSLIGSANQAAELQNMASVWESAAAVTFLRLTVNSGGGSMTGRVKVSSI